MIVLSHELDSWGRPVIEVYMGVSSGRASVLEAEGMLPPQPVSVRALLDTGASRTVVQRSFLDRLELQSIEDETVHTASTGATPKLVGVFYVQLFLAGVVGGLLADGLGVVEAEDLSGMGVDILLGRDILSRAVLFYNGLQGQFTLVIAPPPQAD